MGRREEKIEKVREAAAAAVVGLRAAEAAEQAALEALSAAQAAKNRAGGVDNELRFLEAQIEAWQRENDKRAAALTAAVALDAVDEAEASAWRRSALVAALDASVAAEKRLRAELDATLLARRELCSSAGSALAKAAASRAAESLPAPLHETIVRNYALTEPAEKLLAMLTDETAGRGRFAPTHGQDIDKTRRKETELRAALERAHRAEAEARRRDALHDEARRAEDAQRARAQAEEHKALDERAREERAEIEELAAAHRKRTSAAVGSPSTGAAS